MSQDTSLDPLEGHCPEKGMNYYNASYYWKLARACLTSVWIDLTVDDSGFLKRLVVDPARDSGVSKS